MAIYTIPKNAGIFHVIRSASGKPLVTNGRKGKKGTNISCKTWETADEICHRLNENDHNGTINA